MPERKMPKKPPEIRTLYYITHIDNVSSILQRGILAHQRVQDSEIPFTPIYDAAIVSNRQTKTAPDGRSLWEFANVYFQPRNPMLYRITRERDPAELAVIGVRPRVLSAPGAFVTLGNAASRETEILPSKEGLKRIPEIWDTINAEWWNRDDGSKRKIMAECLIPSSILPENIDSVYVVNHAAAKRIKELNPLPSVSVVPEPKMFFQPARKVRITERLTLAEGDMFFSNMHTLTVSVNVVGVMGKGLASRAKYQFPDVYVMYQDVCRRRKLRMGRPYLYKRESFVDEELADQPSYLREVNANKWFLLFPTKRHWRYASDLQGIREGLSWVRANYKAEGIESLAMPALGCGLGKLSWRDVGPIMCQELANLEVQVVIYLPRERQIPEEFLSPKYLLTPPKDNSDQVGK